MYNRYIMDSGFQPVEPEPAAPVSAPPPKEERGGVRELLQGLLGRFGLSGGKGSGEHPLSGLPGLDKLDSGDILLILVLIYLFKESEDEEWLIILALVLLMGL